MDDLENNNYRISVTTEGYFGVYAKHWDYENKHFYWFKLRVFYTRKEADEYFNSIQDLPKYK